ncbi:hypothetical protein COCSUDRAFT_62374 [Coccomyxa subellipsoidea C-169]|uniref:Uncharacterized protein n=1 Tax=Coccomyxa subellipsoidea (strain C-169) TaxID=574566 RepID=I0YZM5_COCSC|nr:hypothetical protein COCSUDRAFT_62374 [Coccomyxa subellipsoidea C-169]EIE23844.1 hypothetical protein COCSUDRAFT_62374 [Coccomyxa subellipsoidea C-169]|eukprot:XP_005648388.1 hypothetical protein COCSUDRAFT_62374 [Coccomyxa subellipsoidea C-169]
MVNVSQNREAGLDGERSDTGAQGVTGPAGPTAPVPCRIQGQSGSDISAGIGTPIFAYIPVPFAAHLYAWNTTTSKPTGAPLFVSEPSSSATDRSLPFKMTACVNLLAISQYIIFLCSGGLWPAPLNLQL